MNKVQCLECNAVLKIRFARTPYRHASCACGIHYSDNVLKIADNGMWDYIREHGLYERQGNSMIVMGT